VGLASGNADAKDVIIGNPDLTVFTVLNNCTPLTTSSAITHHQFDISAWAGQSTRVGFVYDTLNNFSGIGQGFFYGVRPENRCGPGIACRDGTGTPQPARNCP
jgi:hypothetical protein